ncbi:InlB B-repeat-containing protein [Adlercreutzia sp. ZJ154]|uniref:InlB B-repeat-containing protein n=1 Tax=Adlercreutzia sp. ZJ154 TaxID=2709790 RepID=UPI0013EB5012|nr:InlB B-repeat-containing protein [Adlercreutzia sp. ZJ154]
MLIKDMQDKRMRSMWAFRAFILLLAGSLGLAALQCNAAYADVVMSTQLGVNVTETRSEGDFIGVGVDASGMGSTALGINVTNSADGADQGFTGTGIDASGVGSTALGINITNSAAGNSNFAGTGIDASGVGSTALGIKITNGATDHSDFAGTGIDVNGVGSTALGVRVWNSYGAGLPDGILVENVWDPAGGTWTSDETTINGTSDVFSTETEITGYDRIQAPGVVNREGYTFVGWRDVATDDVYSNTTLPVLVDSTPVHYVAQWKANSFTVTLDNQGGTPESNTVIATYDASLPKVSVPNKAGYDFEGYFTESNGGGTRYYKSDGIGDIAWDIASDTTLFAKWTPRSDTRYVVNHYKQNVADDGYTLAETETLTGTTDTSIGALDKGYTGFTKTAQSGDTTIKGDGSSAVEVKYNRNTYQVAATVEGGGATIIAGGTGNCRYEASTTVSWNVKAGYEVTSVTDNGSDVTSSVANNTLALSSITGVHEIVVTTTPIQYTINYFRYTTGTDTVKTAETKVSTDSVMLPGSSEVGNNGVAGHKLSGWYALPVDKVPSDAALDATASTNATYENYKVANTTADGGAVVGVSVLELAEKVGAKLGLSSDAAGAQPVINLYAAWTPIYNVTVTLSDIATRSFELKNGENDIVAPEPIVFTSSTPRTVEISATSHLDMTDTDLQSALGVNPTELNALGNETVFKYIPTKSDGNLDNEHAKQFLVNGESAGAKPIGSTPPNNTLQGKLMLHLGNNTSIALESKDWGVLATIYWTADIDASGAGPDKGSWLYKNVAASVIA